VQLAAAQLAARANRLDEAQKFAETALKIDPNSADAKSMRAAVARLIGDMKTSESLFEQLHSASPSNLQAANALAQVLVDQDDAKKQRRGLELASMSYQAATEGNKTNRELMATLGWALFRNGKTAEAERVLQQVASAGQLSQDYAYYIAKAVLEPRGQYAAAIRLLDEALKSPQPFTYRLQASELLSELKKKPPQTDRNTPDPVLPPVAPEGTPGATPTLK
jgi:tetratricopeptide (TPR) repeat protein